MSNMKKFMFDNAIFDPPIEDDLEPDHETAEQAEPEVPPPPGVTLDELRRAREEAYEQGIAAGKQTAEAMAQDQTSAALQHMARILDYMLQTDSNERRNLERLIIDGAMVVARRLFPVLVEQGKIEQLGRFAREVLNDHSDEREILIAVPVGTTDTVRNDLNDMLVSRGLTERVKIVEDKTLGPSDCRASWADGGANMLVDRIWKAVEQAAEQALATAAADSILDHHEADQAPDAANLIRDPGPSPVAFTADEDAPAAEKLDFSTLPDWLAAKIAEEPSHIARELGHQPATASADADKNAELVQEDVSGNDQQDDSAPPETDDPNRPVDEGAV